MPRRKGGLRLLELGGVSGLRSQTVWHAIAEGMRPGDRPVLSMLTPTERYVSIGYHRRLDELDLDAVARHGLQVYRRRAGGGPVLCDEGQLHFQFIVPVSRMPAMMDKAWQRALGPAVTAFRRLGVHASLSAGNDIVADARKVSGTGAARIGDALVFVGNLIFRFDHATMADILRVPAGAKPELAALMRRHMATLDELVDPPVTPGAARLALANTYGRAFGGVEDDMLTAAEEAIAARLDERFASPSWVDQERTALAPRVKVRSGVSVLLLGPSWITVIHGRVASASLRDGWVPAPGMRGTLERALTGVPVEREALARAVDRATDGWGRGGELVSAILAAYDGGDR